MGMMIVAGIVVMGVAFMAIFFVEMFKEFRGRKGHSASVVSAEPTVPSPEPLPGDRPSVRAVNSGAALPMTVQRGEILRSREIRQRRSA